MLARCDVVSEHVLAARTDANHANICALHRDLLGSELRAQKVLRINEAEGAVTQLLVPLARVSLQHHVPSTVGKAIVDAGRGCTGVASPTILTGDRRTIINGDSSAIFRLCSFLFTSSTRIRQPPLALPRRLP